MEYQETPLNTQKNAETTTFEQALDSIKQNHLDFHTLECHFNDDLCVSRGHINQRLDCEITRPGNTNLSDAIEKATTIPVLTLTQTTNKPKAIIAKENFEPITTDEQHEKIRTNLKHIISEMNVHIITPFALHAQEQQFNELEIVGLDTEPVVYEKPDITKLCLQNTPWQTHPNNRKAEAEYAYDTVIVQQQTDIKNLFVLLDYYCAKLNQQAVTHDSLPQSRLLNALKPEEKYLHKSLHLAEKLDQLPIEKYNTLQGLQYVLRQYFYIYNTKLHTLQLALQAHSKAEQNHFLSIYQQLAQAMQQHDEIITQAKISL